MSAPRLHVLTLHGVGRPPRPLAPSEAKVWLASDAFRETLAVVAGRDDVRLTFDDGNRSDIEIALPALVERGLTASFFLLAGRLEDPHHLGVDDVARLVQAGMTIGSHGLRHTNWRRLSTEELAQELVESRRILERAGGAPVRQASLPFGAYDRRVLTAARQDGRYERLYTSDGGPTRGDAWLQSRTTVPAEGLPCGLPPTPRAPRRLHDGLTRCVKRWR